MTSIIDTLRTGWAIIDQLRTEIVDYIEILESEALENARLLGMSAEREADLRSALDESNRQRSNYEASTRLEIENLRSENGALHFQTNKLAAEVLRLRFDNTVLREDLKDAREFIDARKAWG